MAGRPKLAKAVHDARGHAGKRPKQTGRENPQPKVAGGEPPGWLDWPPAIDVWKREIGKRVELGMHTEWDVNAFARYCGMQASYEVRFKLLKEKDHGKRLESMLADCGAVIGPRGGISFALIDSLLDLETKLAAFDTQFGLTPKARGSLHVPGTVPDADAAREEEFG